MRGAYIFLAALFGLADCAHPKSDVIIISSQEASGMNVAGEVMEVPFPDNYDGTWLLAHFLRHVEAIGATRVSDIEIETTAMHEDHLRRCVARVRPSAPKEPEAVLEPGQEISKEIRRAASFGPVVRPQPATPQYPSSLQEPPRDSRGAPSRGDDLKNSTSTEPDRTPLRLTEVRWENYWEAGLRPVNWSVIADHYNVDSGLEEAVPICTNVTTTSTVADDKPHRVRATIYRWPGSR